MSRCCRDECCDTRRWNCRRATNTCLERPTDCTGSRPRGVQVCGRCRCRDEEDWNRCRPPESKRCWADDFRELRRRWSEHMRRQSCACDDCKTKSLLPLELEYGEVCPKSPCEDVCVPPNPCSRQRKPRRKMGKSCCGDRIDDDTSCLCQAQPRDCCCPAPVRVDARANRECSCECIPSPECPCPPSERRFPRRTKCCVVAAAACNPKPKKMILCEEKIECVEYAPKKDCRIVCCKEDKHSYQSSSGPGWLAARPGVVGLVSFGLMILLGLGWGIDAMARGPEAAVARLPEMLLRPMSPSSSFTQSFTTVTTSASSYYHQHNTIARSRSELLIIVNDDDSYNSVGSVQPESESPPPPPPADISDAVRVSSSSSSSCWPSAVVPGVQSRQPPSSNPIHSTATSNLQRDCHIGTIPTHRDVPQSSCCARLGTEKNIEKTMIWEQPEKIIGRVEPQLSENARRANQLFEDLKNSSVDCKKNEEVEVVAAKCDGDRNVDQSRDKSPCEKSKKSKKREIVNEDRPDTISTIDLQKPKYIVKCKDKKSKEKPHKCPATCRFFNNSTSPRTTAYEDYHKSLKSKKSKKKDPCFRDKRQ